MENFVPGLKLPFWKLRSSDIHVHCSAMTAFLGLKEFGWQGLNCSSSQSKSNPNSKWRFACMQQRPTSPWAELTCCHVTNGFAAALSEFHQLSSER